MECSTRWDCYQKTSLCCTFVWCDLQRDSQPGVAGPSLWDYLFTMLCYLFTMLCYPSRGTIIRTEDVHDSTEKHFYADNWLQSFSSPDIAKKVFDKLSVLLAKGSFELWQWASNMPDVISHLPPQIMSESSEQWLNHTDMDLLEPSLGLRWLYCSDQLWYKSWLLEFLCPTMRNILQSTGKIAWGSSHHSLWELKALSSARMHTHTYKHTHLHKCTSTCSSVLLSCLYLWNEFVAKLS